MSLLKTIQGWVFPPPEPKATYQEYVRETGGRACEGVFNMAEDINPALRRLHRGLRDLTYALWALLVIELLGLATVRAPFGVLLGFIGLTGIALALGYSVRTTLWGIQHHIFLNLFGDPRDSE